MKVTLQPALVLHARPWRDTSLLVELFTRDHGRMPVIAKGAKRGKSRGGGLSALLQPFNPILCSWSGRSELKTLTACEARAAAPQLSGQSLYCGLYLNEILARLLQPEDGHESLFALYEQTLALLGESLEIERCLRQFEYRLLEELGYRFELDVDAVSAAPVRADANYRFDPDLGLVLAPQERQRGVATYAGAELLRWAAGEFDDAVRRCSKRLMREALRPHIGEKPLKSRELFSGQQVEA